jgi:hypothetical protein
MVAYKFLRPGAVGPFSGHPWPTPADDESGAWVEAPAQGAVCRVGIHGCRAEHLPFWIWEELWEIELDGRLDVRPHKLRAPRGRLIRRIDAWSDQAAKSFATECAGRAASIAAGPLRDSGFDDAAATFERGEDLDAVRARTAELWDRLAAEVQVPVGMASDGALRALTAVASDDRYVVAHGAAVTGYIAAMTGLRVSGRAAYDQERAAQAEWLRRELSLPA